MAQEQEVRLTSVERVLWPGEGITNGDLFDYYRQLTMDAVLERVRRKGDLFEPVLHGRQALGPALRSLQRQSGNQ